VPKAVPKDRYVALRTAFEATLKDPEFVAETAKQRLTIAPMTAPEIEGFLKDLYKTPADVIEATRKISGD
jgi:tripartite-type tricarboxylate transporter receptor subunit TctC